MVNKAKLQNILQTIKKEFDGFFKTELEHFEVTLGADFDFKEGKIEGSFATEEGGEHYKQFYEMRKMFMTDAANYIEGRVRKADGSEIDDSMKVPTTQKLGKLYKNIEQSVDHLVSYVKKIEHEDANGFCVAILESTERCHRAFCLVQIDHQINTGNGEVQDFDNSTHEAQLKTSLSIEQYRQVITNRAELANKIRAFYSSNMNQHKQALGELSIAKSQAEENEVYDVVRGQVIEFIDYCKEVAFDKDSGEKVTFEQAENLNRLCMTIQMKLEGGSPELLVKMTEEERVEWVKSSEKLDPLINIYAICQAMAIQLKSDKKQSFEDSMQQVRSESEQLVKGWNL